MTSTSLLPVDRTTVGPTALHAWLVIADAISQHGMPAPAGVDVYDGTAPKGPGRLVVINLHTARDAEAWARLLDLAADPSPGPWAASYYDSLEEAIAPDWSWSVRCMTDRTAVTS